MTSRLPAGEPNHEQPGRPVIQAEFVELHQRRRAAEALADYAHEHGLRGLTVSIVCQRAQMARGTFYARFGGIAGLLQFAFADSFEQVFAPLGGGVEGEGEEWLRELERHLGRFIAAIEEKPLMAELCLVHSLFAPNESAGCGYEAVGALVADSMRGGRAAGRAFRAKDHEPPPSTEEFLAGVVMSLASQALKQKRVEKLREHRRTHMTLAGSAFFGAGGAEAARRPNSES